MKRKPPQELITTLYRVCSQIEDAVTVLDWYLKAGNTMTLSELNQITEIRERLIKLIGDQ